MLKLTAGVMAILACMVLVRFTVEGAMPKTYLGVSGISFDYIPFWYAKDYGLYRNTTSTSILLRLVVVLFWRKPWYRAVFTLPPLGPPFCKARCRGRIT